MIFGFWRSGFGLIKRLLLRLLRSIGWPLFENGPFSAFPASFEAETFYYSSRLTCVQKKYWQTAPSNRVAQLQSLNHTRYGFYSLWL